MKHSLVAKLTVRHASGPLLIAFTMYDSTIENIQRNARIMLLFMTVKRGTHYERPKMQILVFQLKR